MHSKEEVMDVVRHTFPELLNRLSATVVFERLGVTQLKLIVRQHMKDLEQRLEEKSITLELEDSAASFILSESYDAKYGARPVRRYVEGEVVTELSKMILEGSLRSNCKVRIKKSRARDELEYLVEKAGAKYVKGEHGSRVM